MAVGLDNGSELHTQVFGHPRIACDVDVAHASSEESMLLKVSLRQSYSNVTVHNDTISYGRTADFDKRYEEQSSMRNEHFLYRFIMSTNTSIANIGTLMVNKIYTF